MLSPSSIVLAAAVICIPMHNGHANGSYEDFLTGFVTKDGVWADL